MTMSIISSDCTGQPGSEYKGKFEDPDQVSASAVLLSWHMIRMWIQEYMVG